MLQSGAQVIVTVAPFFSLNSPLAAIVEGGGSRHAQQNSIGQRNMSGICQFGGQPGYIVVVREGQQMSPFVEGPGLRSELSGQAMANLKQVSVVKAGPQSLEAVVIGHRVALVRSHPPVVVAPQGLAHQNKIGLQGVSKSPELLEVVSRQTVGHIQPQTVKVKLLTPGADGLELVLYHRWVREV